MSKRFLAPLSFVLAASAASLAACASGSSASPGLDPAAPESTLAHRGAAFVAEEGCPGCHQPSKASDGVLSGSDAPKGGKNAFPRNLTPDPDTGIGTWTDAQIIGAIRAGVDDQGMPLCDVMPRFASMSDDEAAAIVAYLRSLPAVKRKIPDSQCDGPAPGERDAGVSSTTSDPDGAADDALDPADAPTPPPTTAPAPGELVVSEVMFKPAGSEPNEEWFEIANTTTRPKALGGITLVGSGGRTHVVASPGPVVAPLGYALFVRSRAAALAVSLPGAASAYEYGAGATGARGLVLTNGAAGTIALELGGVEIASAHYGSFALTATGESIELKTLTAAAAASAASWCVAHATWPGGNGAGTPGAANDCP